MEITCPKCNTTTSCAIEFETDQFGCPQCGALLATGPDSQITVIKQFDYFSPDLALYVGQEGVLEGKKYIVTGIIVKKIQGIYFWREYILRSEDGDNLFLSETDGHWILLREVPDVYEVGDYPHLLTHDDLTMDLYDYDNTGIAQAVGFFDYTLPTSLQQIIEYVHPPYIFSIEKEGSKQASFYGQHISRRDVTKAFKDADLPKRHGVGVVQPFYFNIRNLVIIICTASLLILFTHLFVYSDKQAETVLSEELSFAQYSGKDFLSRPFTLQGGSAPMTIGVQTNLQNSWASVQVALINEVTHENIYASKDLEFYNGVEDGTVWTEGSTSEEFNICGVAAGRYHIIITPQKAPEDFVNDRMSVRAVWNEPSMWNVWLPIIFMVAIVVGVYYLGLYFEQRRWADSSFSPHT